MRRALPLLFALPALCQTATVAPALQSRFLSQAESAKVLTGEDYFGLLQVAELRAKTGLELKGMTPEQARAEAKARYAAEAQDFTPAEEAALKGVLARLAPALMEKAPLMARTPFQFIKAGTGVEGGLPHTRGACIVIAPGILRGMAALDQKGDTARLDHFAAELVVHEQTHVLERQHPELFRPLFTEVFGFRPMASAPDAPSLKAARVVNPDGPDLGWAFPVPEGGRTRWIRPDLLLRELEHPRMGQDFREVAIGLVEKGGAFSLDLDAQGQPKVEDLDSVAAYTKAFPGVGESFHPHEIAAVLMAGWITDQDKASDPLREGARAWARKQLR